MKFIALLTAAIVGGRLRHPHEGVLHLEDDEAQRLIDEASGKDVSADFTAEQKKGVPVESVTTVTGDNPAKLPDSHPHQSEVAPSVTEEAPKPAPKGKADKE